MNSTNQQTAANAYALPILMLENNTIWENEVFVTFEEPTFFEEPYDSIYMTIIGTLCWFLGLACSMVIYSYTIYETQGYAASFRTVINQLVTF